MKLLVFLFFILFIPLNILPQKNELSMKGKVISGLSNKPLEYVNIIVSDSKVGEVTNENGYFELNVPERAETILISHLGYKTKILTVNKICFEEINIIRLIPKDIMLQEVSVYNKRQNYSENIEVSNLSLQTDRIEKISNAMSDVLRSFQALPGISVNNEFSAEFNVRGGNKDENLIELNGTQVYEPYHLKEAQNASVGVFNTDLIEKVNIITGGFSARYGDRLSSVANIVYRKGNREKFKGSATLSMAFVDGFIEGPLLDKGSFIIAGRKTYMEYLTELTDFGYSEIRRADPTFYDIQGVLYYDLSKNNKVKLSFLNSVDNWKYDPEPSEIITNSENIYYSQPVSVSTTKFTSYDQTGDYYSSLIDLQSINIVNKSAILIAKLSYYNQRDNEYFVTKNTFKQVVSANEQFFTENNTTHIYSSDIKIKTLEFESVLDYQLNPFYDLKTGISYKNIFYDQLNGLNRYVNNSTYSPEFPDTFNSVVNTDLGHLTNLNGAESFKYSAFIENIFQVKENLLFNIAGRTDYFDMNKELTFSPRFNIAYSTGFGTTLRAAWGHYYQSPMYTQLKSPLSSSENTKSQMAIHYIIGVEHDFNLSATSFSTLKFKLDLFYKDYKNLISSFYSHYDKLFYTRSNDAVGYSEGFDVYILLNIPKFYTWVSYSYLVAIEDKLNDSRGPYPRLTGQTHTLSWIANLNLGKGWDISTKFYYGSGFPYSEKVLTYSENIKEYIWETTLTTTSYLPAYQRFDVRISKDILSNSFTIKTFLEISNVFNHKNVRGYEYTFDSSGDPLIKEILLWPIIPSFGIKFLF